MIIAYDAREAFQEKKTGKGQWSLRLLSELRTVSDITLVLLCDSEVSDEWSHMEHHVLPSGFRWHLAASSLVKKLDIDAYISPTSFIVSAMVASRIPVLQVIHDMIAFQDELHDKKAKYIERFFLRFVVKNAKAFACVSNATAHDLLERFPDCDASKVHTVYAGPSIDLLPKSTGGKHSIVCPGTLCPRKNQLRLLQAYQRLSSSLQQEYSLELIGGRGWDDEDIIQAIESTDGAHWHGYVSDQKYRDILSTSTLLAFPSLYEGFGLPVLDAMLMGIPVLTSNRGSLQEVAGDAAETVDPESVDDITRGLTHLLTDDALRHRLQQEGYKQASKFTWHQTAQRMHNILTTM